MSTREDFDKWNEKTSTPAGVDLSVKTGHLERAENGSIVFLPDRRGPWQLYNRPTKEQHIDTFTRVHLDFIDRLKVLFGCVLQVNVTVIIPVEVEHYNAVSTTKFVSGTKFVFEKDKPDYGYSYDPLIERKDA
jgi:hypothetical protein